MPPWRIFLWAKFIELILQLRPKALWRAFFQKDRAACYGMGWYTRMGRRVWIHEWWNFLFRDRRVSNGPTLEQFWGSPQDKQEIPLHILSQQKPTESNNTMVKCSDLKS
jgi:anaerobic magnesium-protoporphyrin IX monomethyl ester cyclase